MSPVLGGPNAQELADLTSVFADAGSIDPVSNLANSKVFIYSGIIDTVVSRTVVTSLQDYYALFVQSSAGGNITTEYDVLSKFSPQDASCTLFGCCDNSMRETGWR